MKWILLGLLMLSGAAFGQSADQEVVSVVDSPDPATPGQSLTYTIVVRNNGPDAATNGGLNVNLDQALSLTSSNVPAGFTCYSFGNNISCTNPSFAAGTSATITLVTMVPPHLLNFPDGAFNTAFSTSGVTPDPNNGNNAQSSTTSYDSPQIDLSLTVADSPDPVGPDQNITYSATVTNAGPDTATNVNFNVYNNNTLRFQSVTAPAGFACMPPAVGAAPVFTCTAATVPIGTYNFSVVLRAQQDVLGVNDGTVSTYFGTGGTGNDINPNNNDETEVTAYVTPDADFSIDVGDTPDPAMLDGSFEYLVTMTNAGPDTATNAVMNMYNAGTLQFQSIEAPLGYNCTVPAVGATSTLSCTTPSFAPGTVHEFIITVRANPNAFPPTGGSAESVFNTGSGIADPNGSNNTQNETTAIISAFLFRDGFEG
jgi:uncharacterized repeat protein (TIGR01451 family)